jgi:hypothetical protein
VFGSKIGGREGRGAILVHFIIPLKVEDLEGMVKLTY